MAAGNSRAGSGKCSSGTRPFWAWWTATRCPPLGRSTASSVLSTTSPLPFGPALAPRSSDSLAFFLYWARAGPASGLRRFLLRTPRKRVMACADPPGTATSWPLSGVFGRSLVSGSGQVALLAMLTSRALDSAVGRTESGSSTRAPRIATTTSLMTRRPLPTLASGHGHSSPGFPRCPTLPLPSIPGRSRLRSPGGLRASPSSFMRPVLFFVDSSAFAHSLKSVTCGACCSSTIWEYAYVLDGDALDSLLCLALSDVSLLFVCALVCVAVFVGYRAK